LAHSRRTLVSWLIVSPGCRQLAGDEVAKVIAASGGDRAPSESPRRRTARGASPPAGAGPHPEVGRSHGLPILPQIRSGERGRGGAQGRPGAAASSPGTTRGVQRGSRRDGTQPVTFGGRSLLWR